MSGSKGAHDDTCRVSQFVSELSRSGRKSLSSLWQKISLILSPPLLYSFASTLVDGLLQAPVVDGNGIVMFSVVY